MAEEQEKEEQEFNDWLESVVLVDDEGMPLTPVLVVDEDEGEDGAIEE